ncbi:hypothetical protein D9M73_264150 [compost metagenome]
MSREAILAMVGMGLGSAILFESAIVPNPELVVRPIRGRSASATVEAFWAAGDSNPLRHHLLGHLRRQGEVARDLSLRAPAMGQEQDRD